MLQMDWPQKAQKTQKQEFETGCSLGTPPR
jgi:hypothetical protein